MFILLLMPVLKKIAKINVTLFHHALSSNGRIALVDGKSGCTERIAEQALLTFLVLTNFLI